MDPSRQDVARWNTRWEARYYAPTYVIRGESTGLVKIGKAVSILKRLHDLQNMCPVRLVLVATPKEHEVDLHLRFKEYRAHGEWFREEGRLAAWLQRQTIGKRIAAALAGEKEDTGTGGELEGISGIAE